MKSAFIIWMIFHNVEVSYPGLLYPDIPACRKAMDAMKVRPGAVAGEEFQCLPEGQEPEHGTEEQ